MQRPQLSLKGRALRLLSGREHSRAELERKLAGHEEEPGQLRRVLDDLQAKGFIDDARVAESVVHRRAGKLGAARIRQELQAKGLDAELVAQHGGRPSRHGIGACPRGLAAQVRRAARRRVRARQAGALPGWRAASTAR